MHPIDVLLASKHQMDEINNFHFWWTTYLISKESMQSTTFFLKRIYWTRSRIIRVKPRNGNDNSRQLSQHFHICHLDLSFVSWFWQKKLFMIISMDIIRLQETNYGVWFSHLGSSIQYCSIWRFQTTFSKSFIIIWWNENVDFIKWNNFWSIQFCFSEDIFNF